MHTEFFGTTDGLTVAPPFTESSVPTCLFPKTVMTDSSSEQALVRLHEAMRGAARELVTNLHIGSL